MKRRRWSRTIVTTVVVLLPVVLGALWSFRRARDEAAAALRREASLAAAASAAHIDQFLRGLDAMASVLALDSAVIGLRRDDCDRLFAAVVHDRPGLIDIVLHGADGTIKASGVPSSGAPPTVTPAHVRQVITTGRSAVSELTVDPRTQRPAILFGYPVRDPVAGDALAGVLTLELNVSALGAALAEMPLSDGSVATLTSAAGLILARSRDADRYLGTTLDLSDPAPAGTVPQPLLLTDVDGVDRLVVSAALGSGAWRTSVGIPAATLAPRFRPAWRQTVAITALSIIVALIGWRALL